MPLKAVYLEKIRGVIKPWLAPAWVRIPNHNAAFERCVLSGPVAELRVPPWSYFEQLATASASVFEMYNTVSNLVICSTCWNLLSRWQSRTDAPSFFAV